MSAIVAASASGSTSGSTSAAEPQADKAATHTVVIESMRFEPESITVRRGDRVVWVNRDPFPHSATAAKFDSGSIAANASRSYVASTPGDYAYICSFHPTMKGRLVVQ